MISKCGVFCDVTESPGSLSIAMNLFDQSPFNIILVSNHTGAKHIQNNASLFMGGYYEAYFFEKIFPLVIIVLSTYRMVI